MQQQRAVACPDNEGLAAYMWQKRQELAETPKGITDNIDTTLSKAYSGVCSFKAPIRTLKDFSQIKGVGKWILKLMQGFFETNSGASEAGVSEHEDLTKKGKKMKGTKRYVPQKNSVAYALLITLYRGTENGNEFMHKQELIDSAEASGLSRAPIVPEKGKGKQGQFGSSPRDWYSGWSCMKTLITKGLVAKSSCPAKYMLTEEGQKAARECLLRSGLVDSTETLASVRGFVNEDVNIVSGLEFTDADLAKEATFTSIDLMRREKLITVPPESLERLTRMGYSKEQILRAFAEVSETSRNKDVSSLWLAVLCHLREDQVYGSESASLRTKGADHIPTPFASTSADGQVVAIINESSHSNSGYGGVPHLPKSLYAADSAKNPLTLRSCSSSHHVQKSTMDCLEANINVLSLPPLRFGEKFEDVYEVMLILDNREQFATQGSKSRKIIENIRSQFKIRIEVRWLPVGDGIWIARHKYLESEYVLDFIVERKKVEDLRLSIRDNRYKDQKLRLLRCGLKKLIYLVEGDPNYSEAAESIKTACFTTEILEGFDVQRTSGLGDTLRKYGYLTQAIAQCYKSLLPEDISKSAGVCPSFDEFIKRCQHLEKITVSDVFATQLMQVPQVTEEIAIAVLNVYPTLLSLARAYSLLEGDICAQEEMLRRQSNNIINAVASRNIFQLVWGS
ncbi:crossover junction endonuclease MUS81 isoform X2 [Malania oleifera]|uniref:crossover junction endonuclease MUS81 isoform X2 n=1 Tax=Malania oleifera TaxID=397392 RepID=UPI0025AEA523|nr:crossover junction endonuclease MUS81 isoform X2 [Malania oleifera]